MNVCALSGKLLRPAVGFSEGRLFKFVLVTENGPTFGEEKSRSIYVPCVVFEPNKELENALLESGAVKGEWEMRGRVMRSFFDGADGERRYQTEVVIDPYTIRRRG